MKPANGRRSSPPSTAPAARDGPGQLAPTAGCPPPTG